MPPPSQHPSCCSKRGKVPTPCHYHVQPPLSSTSALPLQISILKLQQKSTLLKSFSFYSSLPPLFPNKVNNFRRFVLDFWLLAVLDLLERSSRFYFQLVLNLRFSEMKSFASLLSSLLFLFVPIFAPFNAWNMLSLLSSELSPLFVNPYHSALDF